MIFFSSVSNTPYFGRFQLISPSYHPHIGAMHAQLSPVSLILRQIENQL